jgi:C-terminal processing protease CtpA/Prc
VNYSICAEAEAWPFADFMAEVLGVLDAQPVARVAVDLRANSGGDSRILEPLIAALAERQDVNQTGHLFVLIGPRTYSSALLNTIQFRQDTAALLVGEPTGGEPNHYGELQSFTLPHSGLSVFYSTKHFVYLEGDDSSALEPDQLIPLNAADLFAGHDPVLEAIFGWK